jgi:hypothetical protein
MNVLVVPQKPWPGCHHPLDRGIRCPALTVKQLAIQVKHTDIARIIIILSGHARVLNED